MNPRVDFDIGTRAHVCDENGLILQITNLSADGRPTPRNDNMLRAVGLPTDPPVPHPARSAEELYSP